jgi:hypothetical protein
MKEFHLIPVDTKEHIRSSDCWCKPTASVVEDSTTWVHDIHRPEVSETKDLEEVSAHFAKITGEQVNKEFLKSMLGTVIRVMVAKDGEEIVGMKAYSMVANPFVQKLGFALLVDLGNGHKLELPDD